MQSRASACEQCNQVVSISNMDRFRLLEIYDPQVGLKTINSQLHVAKYPRFVLS